MCVTVCAEGVLEMAPECVLVAHPEDCGGCALCEDVCPEDAIGCDFAIVWGEEL
jgi:NAD-dependent dihydropyrimidine dehydrogenase PreA subunit